MSQTPVKEFKDISGNCHDCGAEKGEFHAHGCDWEVCPICGGQLISCSLTKGCYGTDGLGFNNTRRIPYDTVRELAAHMIRLNEGDDRTPAMMVICKKDIATAISKGRW